MRLAPLLAGTSDEELQRLALEHVRTDEKLPRLQLCNYLEDALRSYRFVSDFVTNRQPPTFALLTTLLDSPGFEAPIEGFRERVQAETSRLCGLIDAEEILARDNQLYLYRRAFSEARRNDVDLNGSESALLTVLRQETRIAQVEHFLIEHHRDLRQFWDMETSFVHEQNALLSAGLIFIRDGRILMPEDMAATVSQSLGIDMPTDSARRVLQHLSNSELAGALEAAGTRTSGSKDARLERILLERIQPRQVLRTVGLSTLKNICRATDAPIGGNKEELVERIVEHFSQRKDQRVEVEVESRQPERRVLEESSFRALFGALNHQELTDILRRFPDLRLTGTKDIRIDTLWHAHLAEATLLDELMNRQLEDVLQRLGLRLGGSKPERIERLTRHFTASGQEIGRATNASPVSLERDVVQPESAEVLANQETFRQKSSNPQASLQPWLDHLIGGGGDVRCYATEDPSPPKQLKNKLSQAASAAGGLLVLLVADESAFAKAREALVGRWMSNAEWSKSVACVALAYPLGAPVIRAIVEHADSPWAKRLAAQLCPSADFYRLEGVEYKIAEPGATVRCADCDHALPVAAKFCINCGSRIEKNLGAPS